LALLADRVNRLSRPSTIDNNGSSDHPGYRVDRLWTTYSTFIAVLMYRLSLQLNQGRQRNRKMAIWLLIRIREGSPENEKMLRLKGAI
jgi:hypothetical protein